MRTARMIVAISTMGVIGYGVWILSGRFDPTIEAVVSSWLLISLDLLFVFLALRYVVQLDQDARLRSGWLLLAFANLSNALAETLWFYYESVLHTDPFPSLADFFYLLYYPLMLMGLLRFPSAPLARRERLILWLDLGILMVAGSMVSWYFILAPLSLTVEQNLAGAIAIAYPVGDLLLLAGVAALIQRDVQKVTWRPMSFLAAGVTFTAVADALFAYFETYAIPYSMPYLNLLWEASVLFQVIAVAWLIYETQTPPRKSTLFSPASRHLLKQSLPYLAVGSGVGLFFFAVNVQHYTDLRMWGLLYGILLLMALVMARQHALLQENTSLYRQMKHIAITDSLTEVYNRHFFNEIFPSELERAARYKQPLSILIVDINNFKTFNDTFGHLKGDDILKETARLLRAQLRSADTIARFGGDEFVVILPATDLEGAQEVAERLKQVVASQTYEGMLISISVGMAQFQPGMSPEQLLEKADRELFRLKKQYLTHLEG